MTAPDLTWTTGTFEQLNVHLLHDILRLRVDVFVVEQDCPYSELDGLDPGALHIMGRNKEGEVLAYARILPPGADGVPHVGRVVVARPVRQKGIGAQLMEIVLDGLERRYGSRHSMLAAQAHLQRFYQGFGYVAKGAQYLLDGIPHVDMVRGDR